MEYKKVNKAGAISVPVKLRRELGIDKGDAVTIEATGDGGFKIKPYNRRCVICNSIDEVILFKNKGICKNCRAELRGEE